MGDQDQGLRGTVLGWFREAPQASNRVNVLKTLIQSAVMWGLALWMVPTIIAAFEGRYLWPPFRFDGQSWVGWGLFGSASLVGLYSGILMAVKGRGTPLPLMAPRELMIRGPYRYVRNPMAVAGLVQGAAVGLLLGSPLVLAYALAGGLLWNFGARPLEEEDLERRFGDSFRRYRREVPCWVPRLSPYSPPAEASLES